MLLDFLVVLPSAVGGAFVTPVHDNTPQANPESVTDCQLKIRSYSTLGLSLSN